MSPDDEPVTKTGEILRHLHSAPRTFSPTEVAQALGYEVPTTVTILARLVDQGLAMKEGRGQYRAAKSVLEEQAIRASRRIPESFHELGGLADIFGVTPGAELLVDDILVRKQGSINTLGTPLELVRVAHRLQAGDHLLVRLRPIAKEQFVRPDYVFRILEDAQRTGYFLPWAKGTPAQSTQSIPKAALERLRFRLGPQELRP